MQRTDRNLTTKQERALIALLNSGSVVSAAEACKINKATLFRWLQEREFKLRYRAARSQLVETAIAQLQSHMSVAVRVLTEVAEGNETPASSRVAAARIIIEQSINAVTLVDLQERVEALERIVKGEEVTAIH